MGSKGKGSGDKVEGSRERGGGKWGLGIPLSTPPLPPQRRFVSWQNSKRIMQILTCGRQKSRFCISALYIENGAACDNYETSLFQVWALLVCFRYVTPAYFEMFYKTDNTAIRP